MFFKQILIIERTIIYISFFIIFIIIMTKERWNEINIGDLLFISGRWRKVLKRTRVNSLNLLTFRKVKIKYLSLNSNTIYCYSDIQHKIDAIIKIKKS